jgi:hypothetical protein
MKRLLAAVVLVGRCVADDAPTVAPEDDWRITKFTVGQPQKIGILTYYPNLGGGYTFLEHESIVFYALPFEPSTYKAENAAHELKTFGAIGTSKVPFGGQTIYQSEMKPINIRLHRRDDRPIAKWSREARDGKFQLSITDVDRKTRLELKSIIPVLEQARNPLSRAGRWPRQ